MGIVLLDSCVIAAFTNPQDAMHSAVGPVVRAAIHRYRRVVVSSISFAELRVGVLMGHRDEEVQDAFFAQFVSSIVPITTDVAKRAAELRASFNLKLPDALILATAELSADHAVTTDSDFRCPAARCTVDIVTAKA